MASKYEITLPTQIDHEMATATLTEMVREKMPKSVWNDVKVRFIGDTEEEVD